MTLSFNSINIGGSNSGGSGGTSNHAQLTNLDYANSGHTGFMSDANYLPNNTIITVKPDGSGDFTTLASAVAFLTGKWSDGSVIIQLSSDNHSSGMVTLDGTLFNIKKVILAGNGVSNTTITFNHADLYDAISVQNCNVDIHDLKITHVNASSSNQAQGICSQGFGSNVHVYSFASEGLNRAIWSYFAGNARVGSNITIKNSIQGIATYAAQLVGAYGSVAFDTCNEAFAVYSGGQIHFVDMSATYTNVTTKCNITTNTANNFGWVTGITFN